MRDITENPFYAKVAEDKADQACQQQECAPFEEAHVLVEEKDTQIDVQGAGPVLF